MRVDGVKVLAYLQNLKDSSNNYIEISDRFLNQNLKFTEKSKENFFNTFNLVSVGDNLNLNLINEDRTFDNIELNQKIYFLIYNETGSLKKFVYLIKEIKFEVPYLRRLGKVKIKLENVINEIRDVSFSQEQIMDYARGREVAGVSFNLTYGDNRFKQKIKFKFNTVSEPANKKATWYLDMFGVMNYFLENVIIENNLNTEAFANRETGFPDKVYLDRLVFALKEKDTYSCFDIINSYFLAILNTEKGFCFLRLKESELPDAVNDTISNSLLDNALNGSIKYEVILKDFENDTFVTVTNSETDANNLITYPDIEFDDNNQYRNIKIGGDKDVKAKLSLVSKIKSGTTRKTPIDIRDEIIQYEQTSRAATEVAEAFKVFNVLDSIGWFESEKIQLTDDVVIDTITSTYGYNALGQRQLIPNTNDAFDLRMSFRWSNRRMYPLINSYWSSLTSENTKNNIYVRSIDDGFQILIREFTDLVRFMSYNLTVRNPSDAEGQTGYIAAGGVIPYLPCFRNNNFLIDQTKFFNNQNCHQPDYFISTGNSLNFQLREIIGQGKWNNFLLRGFENNSNEMRMFSPSKEYLIKNFPLYFKLEDDTYDFPLLNNPEMEYGSTGFIQNNNISSSHLYGINKFEFYFIIEFRGDQELNTVLNFYDGINFPINLEDPFVNVGPLSAPSYNTFVIPEQKNNFYQNVGQGKTKKINTVLSTNYALAKSDGATFTNRANDKPQEYYFETADMYNLGNLKNALENVVGVENFKLKNVMFAGIKNLKLGDIYYFNFLNKEVLLAITKLKTELSLGEKPKFLQTASFENLTKRLNILVFERLQYEVVYRGFYEILGIANLTDYLNNNTNNFSAIWQESTITRIKNLRDYRHLQITMTGMARNGLGEVTISFEVEVDKLISNKKIFIINIPYAIINLNSQDYPIIFFLSSDELTNASDVSIGENENQITKLNRFLIRNEGGSGRGDPFGHQTILTIRGRR